MLNKLEGFHYLATPKFLRATFLFLSPYGSAFGWGTAPQTGSSWVRFPMVSSKFFIDIILPVTLRTWSRLRLWHKWVPEIFPGGKGGRCVGLITLPPLYEDYLEIWEPQHPGTLRACPGLYRNCFTFTFYIRWFQNDISYTHFQWQIMCYLKYWIWEAEG